MHLYVRLFIFTLLVVLCSLSYAQSTLQDSLVAWYPFNASANDQSGNGNNGTLVGPTYTTDRFGTTNAAILLDGFNDYVDFSPNNKFKPQLPVTIAAWIYLLDLDPNPVFNNNYTQNIYGGVIMNINPGVLTCSYGDGGASGPSSRRTLAGSTPLTTGTWYHVVSVLRGPTDMSLYINGKRECGTYSGSGGNLSYSSSPGVAGILDGSTFDPPDYFHGKIDDIRFYNRALNEDEIAALQDVIPGTTNQDTTICTGGSVQLDAGSANTYAWSPAQGLSCTTCQTPVASPSVTTVYQVITNALTSCPDTQTIQVAVQVCNPCDTVNLAALFGYTTAGSVVNFMDLSSGGTTSFWDFGDGNSASWPTGTAFSHTYALPGTYTVCLTNSLTLPGSGGVCADTVCQTVTISPPCANTPVNALFGYITSGLTVNFSDLSTGGTTSIWNFGDGTIVQGAAGTAQAHTYAATGNYVVCLITQATGAGGFICRDTLCQTVEVFDPCSNPALVADFSLSTTGFQFTLTDQSTGAPTALSWDFGDGTSTTSLPGATVSHTYATAGLYTICLTATRPTPSGQVCTSTYCLAVTADSLAPCDTIALAPDFSWSPNGLQILVTDQSAGVNPTSIEWNFGDGTVVAASAGTTTSHTYAAPGPHQICLKLYYQLTLKIICVDSVCKTVEVGRTGIADEIAAGLSIYVEGGNIHINPAAGATPAYPIRVSLFALNGTQVSPEHNVWTLPTQINHTQLASGLYLLKIAITQGVLTQKILIP